jgi:hypothetical protein
MCVCVCERERERENVCLYTHTLTHTRTHTHTHTHTQEWDALVGRAAEHGRSLEDVHVLVLAHVLARPIIVYSSKVSLLLYSKSFM